MTIELLTVADDLSLDGIALLEINAWGGKPDSERIDARKRRLAEELDRLDPDTKSILVAKESETVLGICRIKQRLENTKERMLFGLAVRPDHRRQNIGRDLVQAGLETARTHGAHWIYSQTHADNGASIAFHRALGFHDEGGFTDLDGDEKIAFSIGGFSPS
jgi:ribosomal protein S18 acetylase RimI-like enzyme